MSIVRNASFVLFNKLVSNKIICEVENENGKTMAKFKIATADVTEADRNISFPNATDSVKTAGTITTVRIFDDDGRFLLIGIPFSADNSAPFRFRHAEGVPDSLTFVEDEEIRWRKGTILCDQVKVYYTQSATWIWLP